MATTTHSRRQAEAGDPVKARAEAAEAIAACEAEEAGRLADLREREALARQSLYECEFSRLTRELAKATKEREAAEYAIQRRRDWNRGKLVRNADPAIDRCLAVAVEVFHKVRQEGGTQTPQKRWAEIRKNTVIAREVIDGIQALRTTPGDPTKALTALLARIGQKIPTAPAPIVKTQIEEDDGNDWE